MPLTVHVEHVTVHVEHGDLERAGNWPETRRLVELKAAEVQVYAREFVPVGVTGRLAATIRKGPSGLERGNYYVDILAGQEGRTPYLGYVLYGTIAHEIRPKQNRPNPHLRFVQNGQIVFAKRVWHPGTQANNFLERAVEAAREV